MNPTKPHELTAVGTFNYAHSYASMAGAFRTLPNLPDCTHPEAPIYFLYYHALELYLKAFLVAQGVKDGELRSRALGHNLYALLSKAETLGLRASAQITDIAHLADQTDNVMSSRYLRTGHHSRFPLDVLHQACVELHEIIGPKAYEASAITRIPVLE